ncbi:MAG: uracil-DNA glycosylase [Rhodobacteraceae bacterium]|nr:uracil-DNA glycosylase [Paracoccaceae bacterium]
MFDTARLGAWADLPFFSSGEPDKIADRIARKPEPDILPPPHQVFTALERTQPDATRAVILGQDPYPTPGHAHGLAFSVTAETALPATLRNIFRELKADIGRHPATGDLTAWADQGVLLLNTTLTVPPRARCGTHAGLGWTELITQILDRLSTAPCAYLLWGRHAQKAARSVDRAKNFVIETTHPSPLSASRKSSGSRPFCGSRPFSRVNKWFRERGEEEIDWIGQ